ncbi:hypothetical protein F53441_903 [Fusarium austroafricanum]|uniref:Uncharacterized protein n=1 Tax=Fusarium austroafricanum TaxID=2364996 RepID=A0A8H4KVX9_9HYPO|nr:hypothetical protein F53441_903 [Fusarium austroafricanum]
MRPRPPPQTFTPFHVDLPSVPPIAKKNHYEHPVPNGLPIPLNSTPKPPRIIYPSVAGFKKDGWGEEFDREVATYERLQPLQGGTIPRWYGRAEYNRKRAFVLLNIGGACLATPEGAVLEEKDLRPLLTKALTALADMGVGYDDTKLDNFHLVTEKVKDKIMIVDLEIVDTSLSEDDLAFTTSSNVNHLIRLYRMHLNCLHHDEHLLPKRPLNK